MKKTTTIETIKRICNVLLVILEIVLVLIISTVVFLYRSETPKIFISHLSHLLAIKQY